MPEPCTCRSNQRPETSPMQALHCRSFRSQNSALRSGWCQGNNKAEFFEGSVEKLCLCVQNSPRQESSFGSGDQD